MDSTSVKEIPSVQRGGFSSAWILYGVIILAVMGLFSFLTARVQAYRAERERQSFEVQRVAFEEKTGLHIVRVAVIAGGGMIDLRYQVIDPDKAAIVHDTVNPPRVMDQSTGKVFQIPLMDHAHRKALRPGGTYFTILMNSAGAIKPGSRVTVMVGEERLENVIVE